MPLKTIDLHATDAAQQFVRSLRETGFAVLKNHPLEQSIVQSMYDHWQAFFQSEEKNNYHHLSGNQAGFFSVETTESAKGHSEQDIKEYFQYYPWGACPPQLLSETQAYYELGNQFAQQLLQWVEQYSPAEISQGYSQSLSSMAYESPETMLRVLHYPPLQGDEPANAMRAAAHEDINLLTLLPASNEAGLQVKTCDGQWLDVPCDFGKLIINTGDMLQEASQHYFPSTTHRVINPEQGKQNTSRISMPLFLHTKRDVILSERHTWKTYMDERLRELRV